MAKLATQTEPANPSAWTLRDEMAIRLAAALVIKGGWGKTSPDGTHRAYSNMQDFSQAAYQFADHMLAAMRIDLRNARVDAGLTQQQVAEAIGKDQGTVSRYENGTSEPDKEVALALAKTLNLSVLQVLYPDVNQPVGQGVPAPAQRAG